MFCLGHGRKEKWCLHVQKALANTIACEVEKEGAASRLLFPFCLTEGLLLMYVRASGFVALNPNHGKRIYQPLGTSPKAANQRPLLISSLCSINAWQMTSMPLVKCYSQPRSRCGVGLQLVGKFGARIKSSNIECSMFFPRVRPRAALGLT